MAAIKKDDIMKEKQHDGSLLLSAIVGTQYFKKKYIGYSERDAKTLFLKYVKENLVVSN